MWKDTYRLATNGWPLQIILTVRPSIGKQNVRVGVECRIIWEYTAGRNHSNAKFATRTLHSRVNLHNRGVFSNALNVTNLLRQWKIQECPYFCKTFPMSKMWEMICKDNVLICSHVCEKPFICTFCEKGLKWKNLDESLKHKDKKECAQSLRKVSLEKEIWIN